MSQIEIPVQINDNRIWDPLRVAAQIAIALERYDDVILDLMKEAPNLRDCGLIDFFLFLKTQGLDVSRIQVHTGNMLERSDLVKIVQHPDFMFEITEFQKAAGNIPNTPKQISYHFGNLVSRCTLPRLVISSYLFSNYQEKSFQTFHWRYDHDYHKTHLELEKLLHLYGPNSKEATDAWKLIQHAPLLKETVETYPIIHPVNLYQTCQWYENFFVDVICETWYQEENFFLTEKLWRAIITRTPFILHGPRWILENLRVLGFRTFSDWWDEGYSQDPGEHRLYEIKQVIDYIGSKSLTELEKIYQEMSPVLEHNYQRLMTLTFDDIKDAVWHNH